MGKQSTDARALNAHVPFAELDASVLRAFLANPTEEADGNPRALVAKHGLLVFRGAELTPREEVLANKLVGYSSRYGSGSIWW